MNDNDFAKNATDELVRTCRVNSLKERIANLKDGLANFEKKLALIKSTSQSPYSVAFVNTHVAEAEETIETAKKILARMEKKLTKILEMKTP